MKRKTISLFYALAVSILFAMSCGNRRVSFGVGSELNYTYATIYAPDGSVLHSGGLDSWKDYKDATVDLWFDDGSKFLVHSMNVIMSNSPQN
jgi:hypothetical protein